MARLAAIDQVQNRALNVPKRTVDVLLTSSDTVLSLSGTARIRVTAANGASSIFVGIAAPDPLDAYLTGVEYSTFRDTPKQLEYAVHGGSAPASAPGQQHFWIAQASGTGTQTVLAPAQGHWTLVVMSTDGSRSPSVQLYLDASLPGLPWIAAGLVLLGAMCLAGGAMLLVIPIRKARGSRRPTTAD